MIAVGSDNANGTATTADDAISSFSNDGDGTRNPDLVAPGEHVVSLRTAELLPGPDVPGGPIGDRLFRGSGTSQAAAVVSGAAALLLSQRPDLTPDQVKALLTGTARSLPGATTAQQGAGLIDLAAAMNAPTPVDAMQTFAVSTGIGFLEPLVVRSRQGRRREVKGEVDVRGRPSTPPPSVARRPAIARTRRIATGSSAPCHGWSGVMPTWPVRGQVGPWSGVTLVRRDAGPA